MSKKELNGLLSLALNPKKSGQENQRQDDPFEKISDSMVDAFDALMQRNKIQNAGELIKAMSVTENTGTANEFKDLLKEYRADYTKEREQRRQLEDERMAMHQQALESKSEKGGEMVELFKYMLESQAKHSEIQTGIFNEIIGRLREEVNDKKPALQHEEQKSPVASKLEEIMGSIAAEKLAQSFAPPQQIDPMDDIASSIQKLVKLREVMPAIFGGNDSRNQQQEQNMAQVTSLEELKIKLEHDREMAKIKMDQDNRARKTDFLDKITEMSQYIPEFLQKWSENQQRQQPQQEQHVEHETDNQYAENNHNNGHSQGEQNVIPIRRASGNESDVYSI